MPFVDDALAILGNIGDNRRNLQDLELQLENIVPFVGAGLSVPFGYPNWKKLLLGLAPNPDVRAQVEIHTNANHFEEAAELIARKTPPDDFATALKDAFKRRPLKADEAVHHLPAIAGNLVITTNLEQVVEQVFEDAGRRFQWKLRGRDLHDASGAIQRREQTLIKLHGDVDDEEWILTLKQYRDAYGHPEPNPDLPLPRILGQAIVSRTLLFLGCSLETDRTLNVLHSSVKGLGVQHFAVLQEPDDIGPRLAQLRNWRVQPLFFRKGEYGSITRFLACLARVGRRVPRLK